MKKILCLGLTPALQRTLFFDTLVINEVNRAKLVLESAAGKALNTARALSTLGMPVQVAGLNGGTTGRKIEALLKAYGVTSVQTSMRPETRICTTLIDQPKGTITELVEEAPDPGTSTLKRFLRDNLNHLEQASALVISGTLPPFAPEDFYVPFVRAAVARDIPVIIDSHKAPLLHLLQERPLLVKLNVHEVAITFKRKIKTERDIVECMNKLLALGASNVIITQGAKAAYLMTGFGALWRALPSKLDKVVNPIGSGDCTTAGIVCKLLKRRPLPEALAFGLACGTANATTPTPADLVPRLAAQFYKTIHIERVSSHED
jgi:1-phosphofructokinase family hexose kinase